MGRLLLLKHQTVEAESSPELRFLVSSCVAQARRVFDAVDLVTWDQEQHPPVEPEGAVLLFSSASVYLGHQSLERMWEAIQAGAGITLPDPLDQLPVPAEDLPQTLRGFERLESRLLQKSSPAPMRSSHLPVALLSAGTFADWRGRFATGQILTDDCLLAGLDVGGGLAQAGLYYPFTDYYGETREDVVPLLPAGVESVLEVGCGRGHTGAMLQERLGCRVTGVELNPEVAADAKTRLTRVIVGDVLDLELDLDERFDAVVATELLEHLARPEEFLLRMKGLLRPGGRIVLSTPNVGHHSIVEDLLAGRWDYVPMGLLCYTHVRFFTRATLEDWISRLGFASWEIHPSKTTLPPRFRQLPEGWEVDEESLRTHAFLVVLNV